MACLFGKCRCPGGGHRPWTAFRTGDSAVFLRRVNRHYINGSIPACDGSQGHMAGSAAALLGVIPFLLGAVVSPLVGIAGEDTAGPWRNYSIDERRGIIAYFFLVRRSLKGPRGAA